MKINVLAEVEIENFVNSLERRVAYELIKEIDLDQGDTSFTLDIILYLVKDLMWYDDDGEYKNKILKALDKQD